MQKVVRICGFSVKVSVREKKKKKKRKKKSILMMFELYH